MKKTKCNNNRTVSFGIFISFLYLFPAALLAAPSLQFGLSPNADGQIEPSLSVDWNWNPVVGARLAVRSDNSTSYEDADPGEDMQQSITTVNRNVMGEFVPVLFQYRTDVVQFGLGAGLGIDYYNVQETGFIDIDSTPTRVFFNNARKITAVKPTALLDFHIGYSGSNWIKAGIGYVPLMYINLDHDFSSASDGIEYDTPRTKKSFDGESINAWNVALSCGFMLGALDLELDSIVSGAQYNYRMLTIGGSSAKVETYEIEGQAMLLVSVKALKISGLKPQFGFGVEGARSMDLLDTDADVENEWTPRFSFGFRSN